MRSKDTINGRRILAKVEVPLSVDDIATYALRYLHETGDEDPKDTLVNANKREIFNMAKNAIYRWGTCLLYTSPSPRDGLLSRMPSSA